MSGVAPASHAQPGSSEAAELWHRLLRPDVELSPAFLNELNARMRAERLTFGERIHCPFLRPFFLTAEDELRVRVVAEAIAALGERVVKQSLADPRLLAQSALSSEEERLARINPRYGTSSTASRLDAFLHHPCAFAIGQREIEGRVPLAFVIFPAELHACAAVLVIGFQHEILAAAAHVFQQAKRFFIARGFRVGQQPRPRNMAANQLALGIAEERGVLLVGKHREERFLVRDFARKRIGHANRPGTISVHQGLALGAARNDVVYQNAPIH